MRFRTIGIAVMIAAVLCAGGAAQSTQQPAAAASAASLEEARRLQREGEAHIEARQYKEAAEKLDRALSIRRQALGEVHPDVAQSMERLGIVALSQGDYARAEQLVQNALKIREATLSANDVAVGESLVDLGTVYQLRGDFVRPEPLYQRALSIYEKAASVPMPSLAVQASMAEIHGNLGVLYQGRGDLVRAVEHLARALAIQEGALGPDHPAVARAAANLAGAYIRSRQDEKAIQLLKRAMAIQEKTLPSDHPTLALSAHNLAAALFGQGDYANAEPLFQRALDIDQRALDPRHPRLALRLYALAEVLRMRGQYDRAEPLYERALAIREQALGASHPDVADSWIARSLLRYARGDFSGAAEFLSRGSDVREQTLALVLTTGSEDAKRLYLNRISDETDIALSLHLGGARESATAATLALNDIVQRKGRSLDAMADHLANLRRRLDAADQDVLGRLSSAQGRLAALVLGGIGTPAQQETAAKLRSEIQQLEQAVSTRSAEYRAASSVATLRDVQEALPDGAVLIEFAAYRPFDVHKARSETFGALRYAAYVMGKTGIIASADLGDASRIDQSVQMFRGALASPASPDANRTGRALYQALIRPIEASVKDVDQIFISPDGALNLIPFAALVGPDDKFLVQGHTISYVTSGRDFVRLRQSARDSSRAGGPPMVVANPTFDAAGKQTATSTAAQPVNAVDAQQRLRFDPLPGTAAEADALSKVLPEARVYTGANATESLLKDMRAPSILHIATHGFFLRSTGAQATDGTRGLSIVLAPTSSGNRQDALVLSGLALAGANQRAGGSDQDGILTALEATGLNLWGTRMVVLSACETGVGDARNGEGVYGLRRALVLAGSESQVMSLWQVSDTATTDLMIDYYRRLRAGEGRAEALRNVQRSFLQGGSRRSHPYYWASFIQSGDWRKAFD